MTEPTDIKRQVMSRYKRGELRSPDGHLVTSRAQAVRIAIEMHTRAAAPAGQQSFGFAVSEGAELSPVSDHQLSFVGTLGQHATERCYVCRRCRVQMFEVGRDGAHRRYWGESRDTTPPRCWGTP